MKKIIFLLFVFFTSVKTFAQQTIDSLEKANIEAAEQINKNKYLIDSLKSNKIKETLHTINNNNKTNDSLTESVNQLLPDKQVGNNRISFMIGIGASYIIIKYTIGYKPIDL